MLNPAFFAKVWERLTISAALTSAGVKRVSSAVDTEGNPTFHTQHRRIGRAQQRK